MVFIIITLTQKQSSYNMYYAYFILTQYSAEELNQNDDDMSCVTGVTGITGTTFYTQHTGFNLTKEFGHAAEEARSESKMKQMATALGNLQDFMDTIINQPSKWEDM